MNYVAFNHTHIYKVTTIYMLYLLIKVNLARIVRLKY